MDSISFIKELKTFVIDSKLTLLDSNKLEQMANAIQVILKNNIIGKSAELGVYKGGSSFFIAKLLGRTHYAFDTFAGISNSGRHDQLNNGLFSKVNQANVEKLLRSTNSIVIRGLFTGKRISEDFCFSHFDGDTYESCKSYLNYFYKNTVSGGYMFFDDYGFRKTPGVTMAVDEFLENNNNHKEAFVSSRHQFCIVK